MTTPTSALALLLLAPLAGSGSAELTVAELEAIRDEVIADVEELRGADFEGTVAVEVTTVEGFVEYALERMERMETDEERAADEASAKMMALVPVSMDLRGTMLEFVKGQVGGFYEPSLDTFYVVDTYDDPDLLRVILVHELTHALDDQLYEIDDELLPRMKENSDAALAYHALVEGSGTTVMNQWMLPRIMSGDLSMDAVSKAGAGSDFGDAPEFVWKPLLHSYLRGSAFLAKTESLMAAQMAKPTGEDIDRAFTDPPRSTEQILHPAKYWDPAERDDPKLVELDASGLASGWSLLREDTMGELGLALFTTEASERKTFNPKNPFIDFTNDAAAGWGGDRLVLVGNGDGGHVLHALTTWDTREDAEEFVAALEKIDPAVRAAATAHGEGTGGFSHRLSDGNDVRFTIWSGVDREAAARVVETLRLVVVPEK